VEFQRGPPDTEAPGTPILKPVDMGNLWKSSERPGGPFTSRGRMCRRDVQWVRLRRLGGAAAKQRVDFYEYIFAPIYFRPKEPKVSDRKGTPSTSTASGWRRTASGCGSRRPTSARGPCADPPVVTRSGRIRPRGRSPKDHT